MESIKTVDWQSLDDLIMETIFELLPVGDRFNASLVCVYAIYSLWSLNNKHFLCLSNISPSHQVCRRWASCFDLLKVWRKVNIDGLWLTKSIRNDENYAHSDRVLDYERVTNCLHRIGSHIRTINICQSQNFVSLYQLFILLGSYFDKVRFPNLK